MDANGLKFWMLASERDWVAENHALYYEHALLRLSRNREVQDWPANEAGAIALLDIVPQSLDAFGTRSFWSPEDEKVMATGAVPGNVPLYAPPLGDAVTDVALGYDDLLYVAVSGRIVTVDPRQRFDPVDAPSLDGFNAWRLAAHPDGGVWALDAASRKLARLRGRPSTVRAHPSYAPSTFRPAQKNPDPPRLTVLDTATWTPDQHAIALASCSHGRLAILFWKNGEFARLRMLAQDETLSPPLELEGVRTPFSFAWKSENQVALLLPDSEVNEAPVYTLDQNSGRVVPDGDIYPLAGFIGGPFLHSVQLPPSYPTTTGSVGLYRLSLPSYLRAGSARGAHVIDSGRIATTWHRLYLEAIIPDHCGIVVDLAAVNEPDDEPNAWYPHRFGGIMPSDASTPRGAWVPFASEIPFSHGLLACPPKKGSAGLFTALIQRSGRRVRSLRGRYLKVSVEMFGNGSSTPELAALRAYGSRFSYTDKYLPELYREDLFGPAADELGRSTPADFLERFVDNFEGVLTPLEDRVASSYLLTNPATTPAKALDWLASWIGVTFDSAYTESQRRELISATPELYRHRGTLRGLSAALDIATDGAVSRGQIVILEDYRLRRTFATILGADLSDADDPLLAGIASSGNSYVGDTFILGDENHKEFLSLFGATMPRTAYERAAVGAFLDGLAYRVTILVHRELDPQDFRLIRRVAALEVPAHVIVRIHAASNQFRAGVASLVGVDTYLTPKSAPGRAQIGRSYIGRGDLVSRAPALIRASVVKT